MHGHCINYTLAARLSSVAATRRPPSTSVQEQNKIMKGKLETTRSELIKIEDLDYLEAYARQEKFFKRKDEDIFVITND